MLMLPVEHGVVRPSSADVPWPSKVMVGRLAGYGDRMSLTGRFDGSQAKFRVHQTAQAEFAAIQVTVHMGRIRRVLMANHDAVDVRLMDVRLHSS